MNWISLLLQLLTLRKSIYESRSMMDHARDFAERGKRTLAAFLAAMLAALFFFSGLLVAVIELGLEIDRGNGLQYSGLMVSATILIGIGMLLLLVGYFLGRQASAPHREEPSPRAERVKDILEEFLVSFLSQLVKPSHKPDDSESPKRD
ncbi:MAG: hypothetical protein ACXVCI_08185 [Bdellovibrionota bacterium]